LLSAFRLIIVGIEFINPRVYGILEFLIISSVFPDSTTLP
jgi:hypothetical protein